MLNESSTWKALSDAAGIVAAHGHRELSEKLIGLAEALNNRSAAEIEMKDTHPMQPVVMVRNIARFKKNEIVCHLLDHGEYDMNKLACMDFSQEDREQFAQLIGYSVGGFSTLSYASDAVCDKAIKAANSLMAKQGGAA